MSKKQTQIRQGDVMVLGENKVTIEQLRRDGTLVSKDRCILAEGEATGHAHRVESAPKNGESIEMYMLNDQRYLYVPKTFGGAKVTHEEHNTCTIEPGVHKVQYQREFTGEMARRVLD